LYIDDEHAVEQQKLIASCDMYYDLVDILNRLNMANRSLPALNDLLQQETLRRVRNQLLEDERYQLAMDISTRCHLDTQTIWFQWGMGKSILLNMTSLVHIFRLTNVLRFLFSLHTDWSI
jgi:hypothetical protein